MRSIDTLKPVRVLPVFADLPAEERERIIDALISAPETVAVLSPHDGTFSHWKSKQDDVIDPYGCYCVWPRVTEGNPQ
ncbi:TPA: hypothetical protein ACTYZ0_003581 [Citrobacter werkmanii]